MTTPAASIVVTMPSWPIVTDFVFAGTLIVVSVAVGRPVTGSIV